MELKFTLTHLFNIGLTIRDAEIFKRSKICFSTSLTRRVDWLVGMDISLIAGLNGTVNVTLNMELKRNGKIGKNIVGASVN